MLGSSFRNELSDTDTAVLRAEYEALLRPFYSQVVMRRHLEAPLRRARTLDFPHPLGPIGLLLCLSVDTALSGDSDQLCQQVARFLPEQCATLDAETRGHHL